MESCLNARLKEELGLNKNLHIEDPADWGLLIHGKEIKWVTIDELTVKKRYGDGHSNIAKK